MRSTSTPAAGRSGRPRYEEPVERLAEVVQLHTPTVADPVDVDELDGDQLALPLFFVIDGGAE